MELPYDPAISILGTFPKELKVGSQRDIYALMFFDALFTIEKTWKQIAIHKGINKGNVYANKKI